MEPPEKKGPKYHVKKRSIVVQSIKTKRWRSILVQGPLLFNQLPRCIREFSGSFDTFKTILDLYLSIIPDQPCIQGYVCTNKDLYGKTTNSIIHWIRNLGIGQWECEKITDSTQEV